MHKGENKGHGYRAMRKTNLKEMYIVRYADDFRIFCRTKTAAQKTKLAITQWLKERLKLEVSPEKTRVVNVKRRYCEFLGFKIKVHSKGNKKVVKSHISDKQLKSSRKALVEQVKKIAKPRQEKEMLEEIWQYNLMVRGIQNYYRIATNISVDANKLNRAVMTVITNRISGIKRSGGRKLTKAETDRYGKSKRLRYLLGEPIYPIGYVQHKFARGKSRQTEVTKIDDLRIKLIRQPLYDRSIEYADNRIAKYTAQKGRCAVTGEKFTSTDEIHCHHKIPKSQGGTDEYDNLILVSKAVHKLIHATKDETIERYLKMCKPKISKLNVLRELVGNKPLKVD